MFENIVKFLIDFFDGIKKVWDCLPKELKVFLYVAVSASITQLNDILQVIQIDNKILMGLVNILIVSIAEAPSRVRTLKNK